MIDAGVDGVEFIAVNTDAQALHHSRAQVKITLARMPRAVLALAPTQQLAKKPPKNRSTRSRRPWKVADMVFITIGAGGGTGSGAGHIVARAAKRNGHSGSWFWLLSPFAFEGEKRRRNADQAIENMRKTVDTLIIIPNDRLLQTIDRQTPLMEAFKWPMMFCAKACKESLT